MLCTTETPEGANIGLVRNLAISAHITIDSNPQVILDILNEKEMVPLEEATPLDVYQYPKVIVNGDWVGIHRQPQTLIPELKEMRRNGIINI
jgi:DNA-directed RNA polymerase II subunit RPB2